MNDRLTLLLTYRLPIDVMQYFIHSHGFGSDNGKCVQLLLKGLRQIDLPANSFDRSRLPDPPPMPTDRTRTESGRFPQPIPSRFPAQPPGRSSTLRTQPGPTWPGAGAVSDPNAGYWNLLKSDQGGKVTLSPGIVVQKVSVLGLNQTDYFVFRDHKVAEVNLASRHVYWSMYVNIKEINYFKNGRYHLPSDYGDGINDLDQLKRAVLASREFLGPEVGTRFEELISYDSLKVMATFGGLYAVSQLTPIGWAADGIVIALFIAGCILLGNEAIMIAQLLKAFYETAINAGNNPARYREAGQYFAQAVTKIGIDLLLTILLHKASVPIKRKLLTLRKGSSGPGPGGSGRPGILIPEEVPPPPAKVPVPEKTPTPPKPKGRKKSAKRKAAEKKATAKAKRKVAQAARVDEILKRKADRKKNTAKVGEVEPFDNTDNVVKSVEEGTLPKSRGALLGDVPLTDIEMMALTKQWGVEFAQVYFESPDGTGQYMLYSGDARSCTLPVGSNVRLINHTHPAGTPHPSYADRNYLIKLEKSGSPHQSSVILVDGNPPRQITFDKNTPYMNEKGVLVDPKAE